MVKELNGVELSVSERNLYEKSDKLIKKIQKNGSVSIHRISEDNKDARKNYRLLENDNLEEERLVNAVTTGVGEKVKGCHVLSIQDTSDINYWKNRNRIEDITGLGEVSDNKGLGYFLHPSLVVDANNGEIKGFSDIYLSLIINSQFKSIYMLKEKIKKILRNGYHTFLSLKYGNSAKVFCIGRNKTGTTTIRRVLDELEYKVGDQRTSELLISDYQKKNWDSIIKYCKSAQAFQDVPFSYPDLGISN